MANELTINVSAEYLDADDIAASIEVANYVRTLTTKKVLKTKQTVGITEEALVLGDVSTVGFIMLVNRDDTNFVEVKDGVGGTIVGKMFPGEMYGPVRLGSGMQAPYLIANTAECEVEVFITAV
jgi:hypothetical protein